MTKPLWEWAQLAAAAGASTDGAPPSAVTGFSIDTRTLRAGEVFVALKDQRDGHEFVTNAFKAGAAAALVARGYARRPGDGALLVVEDTLAALEAIGRAARARLAAGARVVAVTGSAGKTTTKEMLRAAYTAIAPGRVHASDKSFNNHWGVPLTLARMPADTQYAVFEIGMNHAGEITPLSRMVRPHVAVVTTVEAVHLAQFKSVIEIADAKAEIFAGLTRGGASVLNRDNAHFERLAAHARAAGARIVAFGQSEGADARAVLIAADAEGSDIAATIGGAPVAFRVGMPGAHIAMNALAVAAVLKETAGEDGLAAGLAALEDLAPPPGRGVRSVLVTPSGPVLLIDETYNANPASMRAALSVLGAVPRAAYGRRIAVLGDMLELGEDGPALHAGLAGAIEAAGVDVVLTAGPLMRALDEALAPARRGAWASSSDEIREALTGLVRGGDVVMIKGSNGSRMAPLADALKRYFSTTSSGVDRGVA